VSIWSYDWLENIMWVDGEAQLVGRSSVNLPRGVFTVKAPAYTSDDGVHGIALRCVGANDVTFLIHDNRKATEGLYLPSVAFNGLCARRKSLKQAQLEIVG